MNVKNERSSFVESISKLFLDMATSDKDACGLCGGELTEADKEKFRQGSEDPVKRSFEIKYQELNPGKTVRIYGAPLKAVDTRGSDTKCEFPYDSDDEDEPKCDKKATYIVSVLWSGENALCAEHKEKWVERNKHLPPDMAMSREINEKR